MTQKFLVKGRKSLVSLLISGAPQGSVIAPLLFLVFIGDLTEGVNSSTLIYVDDAKTKSRVTNEEDVEKHQGDLENIYTWQRSNNMKFNTGKFRKEQGAEGEHNVFHRGYGDSHQGGGLLSRSRRSHGELRNIRKANFKSLHYSQTKVWMDPENILL